MIDLFRSFFKGPKAKASSTDNYKTHLIGGGQPTAGVITQRQHAGGMRKEVSVSSWRTIVSASNKLYWNFGPIGGAIEEKATYAIGRSWLPKFEGEQKEWGKLAEKWLVEQFYPVAYVNGQDFVSGLYMDSVAVDRDGDCGTIYSEAETGFPQLQQIPWHCIGSRDNEAVILAGPYKGLRQHNGVAFNKVGRPVAYHILGETKEEDRWVSARDMDYLSEPRTPDQSRGFPAFTAAIMDLADLMTVQQYVKQAAMLASSIGLIETNETGGFDPSDAASLLNGVQQTTQGFRVQTIEGGTVKYFQAGTGAKLEQLDNKSPSEQTENLMERLIRNALCGAGWAPEFSWKPDGTGANVRMVVARINRTVQDRQDLIKAVAKRRVGWAVSKAIKLGILPPYPGKDLGGSLKWGFTMPPQITVDAGYQGQDTREAYKLGFVNKAKVLAESGFTFADHQQDREQEVMDTLERAKRIADKYTLGIDMALSLFEQRTTNGNAVGGMFGSPLTPPEDTNAGA